MHRSAVSDNPFLSSISGCLLATQVDADETEDGGVVAVIAAMRAHPRILSVQSRGCEQIHTYMMNVDDGDDEEDLRRCNFVASVGGIEVLVAALNAHAADATLAANACMAVAMTLCKVSDSSASVPRAVLAAMTAHPGTGTVPTNAAQALWNFFGGRKEPLPGRSAAGSFVRLSARGAPLSPPR